MVNLKNFLSGPAKKAQSDLYERKWKKALAPGMDAESALEEVREENRASGLQKKLPKKRVK